MSSFFEKSLHSKLETIVKTQRAPQPLYESIRYSLTSPGKRIRPRLCFASGELFSLSEAQLLPAALALEMIHCFTLIHDDLPCLDNDDFRRGLPTNHKVYGEPIALLAGDGLVPLAVKTFLELRSHFDLSVVTLALEEFMDLVGIGGVIGGQAQELSLTPEATLDEVLNVHAKKTGALFRASILIPRTLAGLNRSSAMNESLERFADQLGVSFQVADDLEDPPTPTPAPGSVLKSLSRSEAKDLALTPLRKTAETLKIQFGSSSRSLLSIAQEIEAKVIQT